VNSLAWSPDGKILASHSGKNRIVVLWDIATRQELGAIDECALHTSNELMFSSDGSILASFWGEQIVLWHASRDENSRQ
jgi:WD40 repeat protein